MFDNRRKLYRLRKEVEKVDALYAQDFRAAKTENDYAAVKGEYDAVAADEICNYECFKTFLLRRKADRFGIDMPANCEEYWDTYHFTQRSYLSERGTTLLNRQITDARFVYWKRWIDIVAPTASVIISLLALTISIVALLRGLKIL